MDHVIPTHPMQSAQLRPHEFDAHLKKGTLRLAFVGMSNAGKTYRSKRLAEEKDFLWHHVDGEIQRALGLESTGGIAAWLGLPSDERYAAREREYLALENECTRQASMRTGGKNLVFDTTGSVVHLEPGTLAVLRENCLVVHLDVGEEAVGELIEKFFREPKPVAWCGHFSLRSGEPVEEALRRCYPKLLAKRLEHYRALAHLTIPAKEVRDASAEETLNVIRRHLH